MALMVAGMAALSACEKPVAPTAPPAVVRVMTVEPRDVPVSVSFPATITSPRSVELSARVAGWLSDQRVPDGAMVKSGDIVYAVDQAQYRIELDAATAKVEQATAQEAAARAQLDAANAARTLAQATYLRNESLVESGAISRERWDQLVADRDRSAATANEAEADVALAKANLSAATADQANATLRLQWCTITSPMDGQLGASTAYPGTLVGSPSAQALNTVVQVSPLWAEFSPAARVLPSILAARDAGTLSARVVLTGVVTTARPGTPLGLALDAPSATGTLVFVDNVVGSTTDTIRLRVEFANDGMDFRPGHYAQVTLSIGMQRDAIVVPASATFARQTELLVWVLGDDQTVRAAPVTPLSAWGNEVVISSGLTAGQRIVVEGMAKLRPGMTVQVEGGAPAPSSEPTASSAPAPSSEPIAPTQQDEP